MLPSCHDSSVLANVSISCGCVCICNTDGDQQCFLLKFVVKDDKYY